MNAKTINNQKEEKKMEIKIETVGNRIKATAVENGKVVAVAIGKDKSDAFYKLMVEMAR